MGKVGDAGEAAAQLRCGRELAVAVEGSADRDGIILSHHEHGPDVRSGDVASKRRRRQAFTMPVRGVSWLKSRLPTSRRDRARLAQLDSTRAGMAMIACTLRDLSARHDAHAHAIQRAARASRGALTEAGAANSIRNVFLGQATDAAVRSKQTAEALDGAVDALERMAAALRDR